MQEISRHTIHVREALTTIVDMLEMLYQDQKEVYEHPSIELATGQSEQAQSHLRLQIQMMKSLKERSISTRERLDSEVTLVYRAIYLSF